MFLSWKDRAKGCLLLRGEGNDQLRGHATGQQILRANIMVNEGEGFDIFVGVDFKQDLVSMLELLAGGGGGGVH